MNTEAQCSERTMAVSIWDCVREVVFDNRFLHLSYQVFFVATAVRASPVGLLRPSSWCAVTMCTL